jgi:hypothetical protein
MNALTNIVPEGKLTTHEFREWVADIEQQMMASSEFENRDDVEKLNALLPLTHTFTPGLYTRQISMPAGNLVVSRIHLHEHPFIISKGKVSVYDGENVVTLEAPHQGITKGGTKRVLYIHEDTLWTTFHTTDLTTPEELEEEGVLVCDSFEEYTRLDAKEIEL